MTGRIPVSTYRLQFNRLFRFSDAQRLVPYLHALGVTDCYASSYLKAVPGSLHGYDLADPTRFNPEIGGEEEYRGFVHALQSKGMGQILDIVANHMGIGKSANTWWIDVLENGPSSPYAPFFDIDWRPVKRELEDKVLLPILGDQYGVVLENQEIRLVYEEGCFFIFYYDYKLPIAPRPSSQILAHRLEPLIEKVGAFDPHLQELQSIITALHYLPFRHERDSQRVSERYREKAIIKKRLARLLEESKVIHCFLEENIQAFNGKKGDPRSFDLLDALLNDQAYRLAYWRTAAEEINYRRFFDINELAAIRMENPTVFHEVHPLIFGLLQGEGVTGIRIDHVDGLYDPGDYLRKLQTWAAGAICSNQTNDGRPLFIIVEKILGERETLPPDWPVHGTTGYEFLNQLNGLFIDPLKERAFSEVYTRFIRNRMVWEDLIYEKKKLIMEVSMASEINALGHQINLLSERNRRSRDFTLNSLTDAVREIIACFPVYRTYMTGDPHEISERDEKYIRRAVTSAKQRNPSQSGLVFNFIRDLLLQKYPEEISEEDRQARRRFIMKFQQTTSPVTAKGIEDTAFYVYNRLLSLNEVGGNPGRFGTTLIDFHEAMRERQRRGRYSFSATATHDTKRGEDVRARLNVLSELPDEWRRGLRRWSKLNHKKKQLADSEPAPGLNEEYFFYQTLIGAWPFGAIGPAEYQRFCSRIQDYIDKALKEAKVHTSWITQSHSYEEAVHRFIEAVLDRSGPNPFLDDLLAFQEKIAEYGIYNSLSQLLIKIAAPGIPDFYQGSELWDFRLVDPDNRQPVDYEMRSRLMAEMEAVFNRPAEEFRQKFAQELVAQRRDGRIKLYLTRSALLYRRERAPLFLEGNYLPLEGVGEKKEHLCAFARTWQDQTVIIVVPRLMTGLIPDPKTPPLGRAVWGDTSIRLPPEFRSEAYSNILTGACLVPEKVDNRPALPLASLFGAFPVALLEEKRGRGKPC